MSPAQPGLLSEGFRGNQGAPCHPPPHPFQGTRAFCPWKSSGRESRTRAGLWFLVIGSREFPGRGLRLEAPGEAPSCVKASFLLRLSPVILLEPGLGLEGECALAGVVGFLWARLTLQSLGALSPPPLGAQSAASYQSGEEGMSRTVGGTHSCPPTTQLEPGTPRFLPL